MTRAVLDADALDLGAGADLGAVRRARRRRALRPARPRPPIDAARREPAPLPSPAAAWSSRFAVVPADQGPPRCPWMPRAADDRAHERRVANHSRREVGDRHRPPAQQALRVLAAERRGSPCRARARAGSGPQSAGRCRAASASSSAREQGGDRGRARGGTRDSGPRPAARACAARTRSRPRRPRARRRARPGSGAKTRGSGLDEARARGSRGRASSTTDGAQRARARARTVEALNPGWNSSVTAAPPRIVAPLEDERLRARPREQGRGGEAVVARRR